MSRVVVALRRRVASDGGFTMVELAVACGIITLSLLALAYTAGIAFQDIALSRQRQSANSLANEAIEQARGLPFDDLAKGLASWDLSGDPNIVTCGVSKCFDGERIPTSGYPVDKVLTPLVPHIHTATVGPTTYTVAVYVTHFENVLDSRTFRLNAVVTWAGTVRPGSSTRVQTQTVAFSPEGCVDPSKHPFAAPCQPFVYANAASDEGEVVITGSIDELDLEHATIFLPGQTSSMQVEQISAAQGTVETSGAAVKIIGQSEQLVGHSQASSGADNDPSQPQSDYSTASTGVVAGGTLVEGDDDNRLSLFAQGGDAGQTISTTSATLNPPNFCPDWMGVDQNDALPCGNSNGAAAGELWATLELEQGDDEFGDATLIYIEPASTGGVAYTNRALLPEDATCVAAVGDGCVHGNTRRTIGDLYLGGLFGELSPLHMPVGWQGYLVSLTGYQDVVSAEAGWGSAAPTVSAGGTVSYWNGLGYSTLTIAPGDGVEIPVSSVVVNDPTEGALIEVMLGATLRTGGTDTQESFHTCDPACPETRLSASALANPPLVGDITYRVRRGGNTVVDLKIAVNLGFILAQTSYQPAPDGT